MKIGQYFTLSHSGIYTDTPQEAYSAAFDYIKENGLI
jgi:effector-binding domain-containing protein